MAEATFRSQTTFGKFEKVYRRPALGSLKKNSKKYQNLVKLEQQKILNVYDFAEINNNTSINRDNIKLILKYNNKCVYGLKSMKGLFMIPGYFDKNDQYYWIKECLQNLSNVPYNNLTNLEHELSGKYLFDEYKCGGIGLDSFKKLTWSNIGIKYDWTARKYDMNNVTFDIKDNMKTLCDDVNEIMNSIDNSDIYDGKWKEMKVFSKNIIPQTSIINFFECNTKRPMGGHRDNAELINAPLISVSLGNTAIFLIGYENKSFDEIYPIYLRSGDVLIMSGDSRFKIHSVSRVLNNTFNESFNDKIIDSYMKNSRINFNIRQVYDMNYLFKPMNSF